MKRVKEDPLKALGRLRAGGALARAVPAPNKKAPLKGPESQKARFLAGRSQTIGPKPASSAAFGKELPKLTVNGAVENRGESQADRFKKNRKQTIGAKDGSYKG